MSWWDPITDWFTENIADPVSHAVSAGSQYIQDALPTASDAVAGIAPTAASAVGDSSLGSLGDFTQGLGGLTSGGSSFPNIGDFSGGAPSAASSSGGLFDGNLFSGDTPGHYSNVGIGSGIAESGGAGLLDKATDWAKKNPDLVNPFVQAGLTLTRQTSPSSATKAGYDATQAANASAKDIAEQKTAVGKSLINQAPGYAANAEAASKLAGANAEQDFTQRMAQQGYKAGDAQYESGLQQLRLGNRSRDTTAYAQGQDTANKAMGEGAGLLTSWTPNMTGYSAMANEQNAQQGAQNKQMADTAAAAKTAFDIWSNPDKPVKETTYS